MDNYANASRCSLSPKSIASWLVLGLTIVTVLESAWDGASGRELLDVFVSGALLGAAGADRG